ncbi:semaphorin-5A-like [Clytia hemisphaerica]|uniref:Sema domain-containing protein n=1 Tax=Clytia hemisphaerica TaxID=252671 RepID=A0A7M5V1Z1_9CNID
MEVFVFLLLTCVQCLLVFGDVCIPAKHRKFTKEDLKRDFNTKEISKSSAFQSIVTNEKTNKLYTGGRNSITVLDGTNLNNISHISWKVDNERCLSEGLVPKEYCNNHVTLINLYKDKIVACGTGSTRPVYRVFSQDSLNVTREGNRLCASPNPEHRVIGQITSLGEMIVATYKDQKGRDSEVHGSFMPEKLPVYRAKLKTGADDVKPSAEFIKSFYIGNSVYKFFIEEAEENGNQQTPTVGRFCQTDNGGPSFISNRLWTTFRKARLNCFYNRADNKMVFRHLVDVDYDATKKIFYAIYTMTKHESLASTICTFKFEDLEEAFSGNFLAKNENNKEWNEIQNPKIFNGCKVNRTKLSSSINPTSPGKEPTNSLNLESSMFVSSHRIMAKTISTQPDIFQYMKPVTRFSKIAIDQFSGENKAQETLLNIIDDQGNIFTLHANLGNTKESCIIEEIATGMENPKIFQMNHKERMLYITTSDGSRLMTYNVDSCARYNGKSDCISAHNPRCGWNMQTSQCLSVRSSGNETLLQDLNKCPNRLDIFSAWSSWKAQEQEGGQEKYCLVRHRQCHSCDLKLCDVASTEVINCTANAVTDIDRWLKEGAIDGSWSSWQEWSECGNHVKCGNDTKIRSRQCESPKPANGGRECIGRDFECTTCPKKKEIINIIWTQWSKWSNCPDKSVKYETRARTCSKPGQCNGKDTEKRDCPEEGVAFGEWSNCSCMQKVQHRCPKSIVGCGTNCPRMELCQYQTCEPKGCPTEKPPIGVDESVKNNSTKNETSPSDGGKNSTEYIEVVPLTPAPNTGPMDSVCKDGYTFQLVELISIGVGIIASCFVIVLTIVFLMIRRDRKKNNYSPNPVRKTKSQPLLNEDETDTLESNA